jgi:putative DNA-invertase from lambdoid prophage Rac
LKACIYARVSTTDQNCESQLADMRQYCAARGWEIAHEYADTGQSGTKTSRPQLDRMMAAAQKRKFDAVVVWKLDRFGRSLLHCVSSIQELSSLGVRFVAISQGLDTDQANPTAQLLLHILAAVAEFERGLIHERVIVGMRTAKAKGKHVGRPKSAVRLERVQEMRNRGLSLRRIADETGVSAMTIQRILGGEQA